MQRLYAGREEKEMEKGGKAPHQSAYMKVYTRIREEIETGVLRPGDRLPSKRMMAQESGVSVITVEHAYALLADEEYIRSRPRSGFFVEFGRQAQEAPEEALRPVPEPAPLKSAPQYFPFSVFAKIMRRVITEYDTRILTKTPSSGSPELRGAIAAYLRRSRGVIVRPEQVIVGSGAEYLYGQIVQLLGRDTVFALEDPSYETIRRVYEANGARCVMLPLGRAGIRSEALLHCTAGALHVTPFHSYPSGVTASAAKRHEYVAWARRQDSILIEDDYDGEFATRRKQISTILSRAPERVIYVNTFSKTVAPSMRMGYMVLPMALVRTYEEKLGFYSCTVPAFEQYVLAAFINEGHLERYINRRRRKNAEDYRESR